ncbi:MAG: 5'-methylthioadenosine/S-adenosylhomocysteine nucleosidase [Tissierellia bacterium]|nr:5'-methylthioadenosine/S-adenosylhomocysteine nucleosidase [Tissierellia bacterium]
MKIAILGAYDREIEKLFDIFENIETKKLKYIELNTAKYNDYELVFAECGIGKVASTMATQLIIDSINPDYIINIGVCGSLSKDAKIGDTFIGAEFFHHDQYHLNTHKIPLEIFKTDTKIIDRVDKIAAKNRVKIKKATIATGDAFIESTEEKEKIINRKAADLVDMESAAIVQTCIKNDIKFLILRSVSDNADENANCDFYKNDTQSSIKSVDFVKLLLDEKFF